MECSSEVDGIRRETLDQILEIPIYLLKSYPRILLHNDNS